MPFPFFDFTFVVAGAEKKDNEIYVSVAYSMKSIVYILDKTVAGDEALELLAVLLLPLLVPSEDVSSSISLDIVINKDNNTQ